MLRYSALQHTATAILSVKGVEEKPASKIKRTVTSH